MANRQDRKGKQEEKDFTFSSDKIMLPIHHFHLHDIHQE